MDRIRQTACMFVTLCVFVYTIDNYRNIWWHVVMILIALYAISPKRKLLSESIVEIAILWFAVSLFSDNIALGDVNWVIYNYEYCYTTLVIMLYHQIDVITFKMSNIRAVMMSTQIKNITNLSLAIAYGIIAFMCLHLSINVGNYVSYFYLPKVYYFEAQRKSIPNVNMDNSLSYSYSISFKTHHTRQLYNISFVTSYGCNDEYKRVRGEDVELFCYVYFIPNNNIPGRINNPIWKRNGHVIQDSIKYKYNISGQFFSLFISNLKHCDLNTTYELWITPSARIGNIEVNLNDTMMIANMTLTEEQHTCHYVYASQGHLLNARADCLKWQNGDITLIQNIQSFDTPGIHNDASSVCSSLYSCSPLVRIIYWFRANEEMLNTYHTTSLKYMPFNDGSNKMMYHGNVQSCVCREFYGLHWFSIRRKLYNNRKGQYYYQEFDLPTKFFVLPHNESFLRNNKYEIFRNAVQGLYESGKDWNSDWKYLKDDLTNFYMLKFNLEMFAVTSILLLSFLITVLSIHLSIHFAKKYLCNSLPDRLIMRTPTVEHCPNNEMLTDKVAILNAEEDDQYTSDVICQMVSNFGFSVGSTLDINPGELRLSGLLSIFQNARLVVVNFTEHFLNDSILNECILQLILTKLVEEICMFWSLNGTMLLYLIY